MKKRLMLLFLVAGICVLPVATHAATVTEVVKVYMDGATDPNSETSTTGTFSGYTWTFRDYINDSASPSQTITVIADQYGNFPTFDANDGMYVNGHDSANVIGNGASKEVDEGMQIDMGAETYLAGDYIWEAWVKPDWDTWDPEDSGTEINAGDWSMILRWWDNYGFAYPYEPSDPTPLVHWEVQNTDSSQGSAMRWAAASPDPPSAGDSYDWYNSGGDPCSVLSGDEFTHIGMVMAYDTDSNTCDLDLYINGQLSGSLTFLRPVEGFNVNYPQLMGIGNNTNTGQECAADPIDGEGYGAFHNYNMGFCGWIKSFAYSTYTGEFAGQHEFVLVDPQECGDIGTEYRTADFNQDCTVNFADFAGMAGEWLYEGM